MEKQKHNILPALLVAVFLLPGNKNYAQITDSIPSDTLTRNRLIVVPIISFTPETNWQFGIGGLYYLKPSPKHPNTHPTLLKLIADYTLNKQIQTEFSGDIYRQNNLYLISFLLSYYKFPDSFFGLGNETESEDEERYTISHPYLRIDVLRELYPSFSAGIKTFFEYSEITDEEEGGILDTAEIPGEDGGLNTGAGIWLRFDTRDNIYYPLKGIFIDLSTVLHGKFLGSDYSYSDNVLDASTYFRIHREQVLGLNLYGKFQPGNPPFNRMAELGGPFRMRGNFEGRFRDKYYLTFQSEYRIPVWKFFGTTIFGGIGEVADTPAAFTLSGLKYSYGAGIRLKLVPGEKLNLRVDYGFGSDGGHGLYVQFNEAF